MVSLCLLVGLRPFAYGRSLGPRPVSLTPSCHRSIDFHLVLSLGFAVYVLGIFVCFICFHMEFIAVYFCSFFVFVCLFVEILLLHFLFMQKVLFSFVFFNFIESIYSWNILYLFKFLYIKLCVEANNTNNSIILGST